MRRNCSYLHWEQAGQIELVLCEGDKMDDNQDWIRQSTIFRYLSLFPIEWAREIALLYYNRNGLWRSLCTSYIYARDPHPVAKFFLKKIASHLFNCPARDILSFIHGPWHHRNRCFFTTKQTRNGKVLFFTWASLSVLRSAGWNILNRRGGWLEFALLCKQRGNLSGGKGSEGARSDLIVMLDRAVVVFIIQMIPREI